MKTENKVYFVTLNGKPFNVAYSTLELAENTSGLAAQIMRCLGYEKEAENISIIEMEVFSEVSTDDG